MKIKTIIAIAAMLTVVSMGSCKKDETTILKDSTSSTAMTPGASSVKKDSFSSKSMTPVQNSTSSLVGALMPVNLGVAGNFAILSKTGITDVYASAVTGDVGTSPITGAALLLSCTEVVGTIYTVDAAGPACKVTSATMLTTAIGDMQTAYTDAAGRSNPDFLNLGAGNIGGLTLTPGLYKWSSSLVIPTDITISGSPTDIFIFQVAGTLNMSSAVKIILSGGVQAKNIFWQVAGAVTLGTTSHFEGIILGQTGINLQTGASINGRTLAQTAVTLQKNTVTQP